ncbi:hypothetical protein [Bradyrhizobium jicamae]|uniref:hypothetical protein n=1 Tax=Bradyrhizobium jicamae TaxID=280332 RepID=UPI001BA622F8|nr:hypothetical protein [Bradyrhizobium jicamae]MBR0934229.1 hypothetical protein [Bradyrhizobium jicamae]
MSRELGAAATIDPTDHGVVGVVLDLRLPATDAVEILLRSGPNQSGVTATTR